MGKRKEFVSVGVTPETRDDLRRLSLRLTLEWGQHVPISYVVRLLCSEYVFKDEAATADAVAALQAGRDGRT